MVLRGKIIHERAFLSVLFLCIQINHTGKELFFLIFKKITLRNHSSLHKTFYSLQKNAENPVDTKVDTSGLQGAVDDASTTQTDPKHYKYTATSKS